MVEAKNDIVKASIKISFFDDHDDLIFWKRESFHSNSKRLKMIILFLSSG